MTDPEADPLPPAEHHAAEAAAGLWGLALARLILAALRHNPGPGAEGRAGARLSQKGISSAAVTKRATTFFSPAFSKATVSLSPSISVTAP